MAQSSPSGSTHVFELYGSTALAWFFVMANWTDPGDKPDLKMRAGSNILFCATRGSVEELRRILGRALVHGGAIALSADALLADLKARSLLDLPHEATGKQGTAGSHRARPA